MRIKEGMKARFEAIFAGNPRPNIIWLFNGEEIQGRMESQFIQFNADSVLASFEGCVNNTVVKIDLQGHATSQKQRFIPHHDSWASIETE